MVKPPGEENGRGERMTPEEKAEITALIHALYDASGDPTWAAFARRAGVSEYSLSDWRSGRGAPSAINLLRLQRAAGSTQASLPNLESRLEEVAALAEEGFARLEAGIARVETRLEGGDAQAPEEAT